MTIDDDRTADVAPRLPLPTLPPAPPPTVPPPCPQPPLQFVNPAAFSAGARRSPPRKRRTGRKLARTALVLGVLAAAASYGVVRYTARQAVERGMPPLGEGLPSHVLPPPGDPVVTHRTTWRDRPGELTVTVDYRRPIALGTDAVTGLHYVVDDDEGYRQDPGGAWTPLEPPARDRGWLDAIVHNFAYTITDVIPPEALSFTEVTAEVADATVPGATRRYELTLDTIAFGSSAPHEFRVWADLHQPGPVSQDLDMHVWTDDDGNVARIDFLINAFQTTEIVRGADAPVTDAPLTNAPTTGSVPSVGAPTVSPPMPSNPVTTPAPVGG